VGKLLLDAGADVNAQESDGETVLDLANENGKDDVVALLTKHIERQRYNVEY
jgi:ankyrin repeat protein